MNNLANSYSKLGRHVEARKLYEEKLSLRKAKRGPDHADTLASMEVFPSPEPEQRARSQCNDSLAWNRWLIASPVLTCSGRKPMPIRRAGTRRSIGNQRSIR